MARYNSVEVTVGMPVQNDATGRAADCGALIKSLAQVGGMGRLWQSGVWLASTTAVAHLSNVKAAAALTGGSPGQTCRCHVVPSLLKFALWL
jgi:hypothetical protein